MVAGALALGSASPTSLETQGGTPTQSLVGMLRAMVPWSPKAMSGPVAPGTRRSGPAGGSGGAWCLPGGGGWAHQLLRGSERALPGPIPRGGPVLGTRHGRLASWALRLAAPPSVLGAPLHLQGGHGPASSAVMNAA